MTLLMKSQGLDLLTRDLYQLQAMSIAFMSTNSFSLSGSAWVPGGTS